MRYGPPSSGQAYHLVLQHLRQPSALDAPWIRLLPADVPPNEPRAVLCRCAGRAQPWGDEYGLASEVRMRSVVRLLRVSMPPNAPPREPALGDAWAYLIGRCVDCGTVWWAPLEASRVRG
jgi:hypothetical protein